MTITRWFMCLLILLCFTILILVMIERRAEFILETTEQELTEKLQKEIIEIKPEINEDQIKIYANYIKEYNYKVFPELATLIATDIISTSTKFNIPAEFLLALIQVESSFNYFVISNADCIGLLQINPKVWVQDKENPHNLIKARILKQTIDLYDPVINLHAGAYIFKHYYKQGLQKKIPNPLKYTLTRYFGGIENSHYTKFITALGEFLMFKFSMNKEDLK